MTCTAGAEHRAVAGAWMDTAAHESRRRRRGGGWWGRVHAPDIWAPPTGLARRRACHAAGVTSGPDCPFCAIAAGVEPAEVVVDDGDRLAFLDRVPLFHGHVLVAPRRHAATLADLAPEELGPLLALVQRVGAALGPAVGAEGSFVAVNQVVSQSVPHLHVHVVPRRRGDGLRGFFWPRHPYDGPDQMAEVAERLRGALAVDGGTPG